MGENEAVTDGVDIDSQEDGEGRRERRWWGLLAVVLLLLLLMFCAVLSIQTWVTGGPERARFIARNVECLKCHTELIPDFNRASVHSPFATKDCETCHTPHGKKVTVSVTTGAAQLWRRVTNGIQWLPITWWYETFGRTTVEVEEAGGETVIAEGSTSEVKGVDSELVLPEDELCWMCHGDLGKKLDEMYVHQPFDAGRCGNCHNPHASDNAKLLSAEPNKICFTCHPMGMELGRKQAHPPAETGWCIDCHDPHGSEFKGMIVAAQRELCFRCHPSVATLSGMAVQHAPFANDECTGCHQPHGSNFTPLLNAEQPRLCYECHPQIADQFAQPSTHPIGVKLDCGDCHEPHAAQYSALLNARDNAFCYECHSSIRPAYSASRHDGQLCVACHTPHGSRYQPILRDSNPDVCLRCHEPAGFDESSPTVYRNNHPVRPNRFDIVAMKPLTCTSTCHNPHGTKNNYMLRVARNPLDANCIVCHAVTEGNKVGVDY